MIIIIEKNEIFSLLIPVIEGLGEILGDSYEIVLHDVSRLESSIVAIKNGHVTGRCIGGPATDFLLDLIKQNDDSEPAINYVTTTDKGKKLKSSTILIRNESKQVIGALCINVDITRFLQLKSFIDELVCIKDNINSESFPNDVNQYLELIIEKSLLICDKPVDQLLKEDKLKIIEYLNNRDIFDIKGAVNNVAQKLNVSKYTIYNYIDEVNTQNQLKINPK